MSVKKHIEFEQIFEEVRTIAVVGLSDKIYRDSGRIGKYLKQEGYEVYGVHPALDKAFGITVYPHLQDVPGSIDLVNVFLRSDKLERIKDDVLAVKPKYVWLQLGIHNDDITRCWEEHGITVIEGYCIAVEHSCC